MSAREERTMLIGWHGISVRVPEDWTLGAMGGDRKAGYLRVDDERMPRLQVKWSRGRIDLERKREEYIKRLTVGKRKRPTGLEVSTDFEVISHRSKPKKEMVTFAWRGPQCGMGVLWNCEVCQRALIAQISWLAEEDYEELAREVLRSLDDHAVEGWEIWGLDGLAFLAPEKYEIVSWKRMTRYLELQLAQGAAKLKVARWGMVPLVLHGRGLKEWYEEENRGRRDVEWEAEEAETKGHEGLVVRGEKRRLAGSIRSHVARAVKRPSVAEFGARVWHCPESNRLYLVEGVYSKDREILQGVTESIICHEEA